MGTWRRPSCTAMVWPTISGKMVESRDQVRNTSLRPPEFIAITRLISLASTKGPFFRLLLMCTNNLAVRSPAAERHLCSFPDDEFIGALVVARLFAHGDFAPLGLGLAADGGFAFATAVGMVARVHGRTAHRGPEAHVPRATGLADADRGVLRVTDLAQGRHALDVHQPNFAGRQAHLRPHAFLGHQLRAHAGAADHLPTAAGLQLDVVDDRADRDVSQRERVARRQIGLWSRRPP